jgi:hypothetical protein
MPASLAVINLHRRLTFIVPRAAKKPWNLERQQPGLWKTYPAQAQKADEWLLEDTFQPRSSKSASEELVTDTW